jgi:hypothetical protein
LLSKKFGFGIVGFVKKSGFYVLGLILLATIFLACLKGFDIWLYNKDRTIGAVIDNELDQTTMRTFEFYPFSTLHIQSYAHTKGWNGVGHITNREEKFYFRSGDHGFFVDIDIDHPPTKEPNEYRIILTGGSGAQGFGGTTNDRMLYRRLEAELNKIIKATNGDTKVRVINLAMAAQSTSAGSSKRDRCKTRVTQCAVRSAHCLAHSSGVIMSAVTVATL